MSKKTLLALSLSLLMLLFIVALGVNTSFVSALEPTQLKIYVGPTSVPADNKPYDIVAVQLQDAKKNPARAEQDTIISLSSSLTGVGTVDPSITIPKGSTYGTARFHSTFSPGSTTITATASGYATVQAKVVTTGPVPSALAVYAFPPVIPADGGTYPAIVVQLQDSGGFPARAPLEGLLVTLSCSNTAVGTVDASVTIIGGTTFAVANFKTAALLPNQTGTATVTAIASGYSSKQTTVATQGISTGGSDLSLKVYVDPPKMMADAVTYEQVIAVQAVNSAGKIVRVPSDVVVTLSSSNTVVGSVQPTIKINQSSNYALAKFDSTLTPGITYITAAATDYKSATQTLTTMGPVLSKLAVYGVPSNLPSDAKPYDAIRIQLQDDSGNPAKNPAGNTLVYLFSSELEGADVEQTITISFGETQSTGTLRTTSAANSTTITAQASGYGTGQTKITTYLIDKFTLNLTVTAEPATLKAGEQATIRAFVTYNGTIPAPQSKVVFTSNKGGSFSATADEGNGYYTTSFTAPAAPNNTQCTITANSSKSGYNSTIGKVQVTINPGPAIAAATLHIIEENSDPVSEANVTLQSQETNGQILTGTTNQTGYLTFENLTPGNYAAQITKPDYDTKNVTIEAVAGQTAYYPITLSKSAGFPWLIVIAIVAVTVVAVVAVYFFVIRKRREQPEETTEETVEETLKETLKETAEETPKETSKEVSEETAEEAPEETPKEPTEKTLKEASEETPEEKSKETTEKHPKRNLKKLLKEYMNKLLKHPKTPKETAEETPKETTEEASKETPEEPSKEISEETPEETPKEKSKETPEKHPKRNLKKLLKEYMNKLLKHPKTPKETSDTTPPTTNTPSN